MAATNRKLERHTEKGQTVLFRADVTHLSLSFFLSLPYHTAYPASIGRLLSRPPYRIPTV